MFASGVGSKPTHRRPENGMSPQLSQPGSPGKLTFKKVLPGLPLLFRSRAQWSDGKLFSVLLVKDSEEGTRGWPQRWTTQLGLGRGVQAPPENKIF